MKFSLSKKAFAIIFFSLIFLISILILWTINTNGEKRIVYLDTSTYNIDNMEIECKFFMGNKSDRIQLSIEGETVINKLSDDGWKKYGHYLKADSLIYEFPFNNIRRRLPMGWHINSGKIETTIFSNKKIENINYSQPIETIEEEPNGVKIRSLSYIDFNSPQKDEEYIFMLQDSSRILAKHIVPRPTLVMSSGVLRSLDANCQNFNKYLESTLFTEKNKRCSFLKSMDFNHLFKDRFGNYNSEIFFILNEKSLQGNNKICLTFISIPFLNSVTFRPEPDEKTFNFITYYSDDKLKEIVKNGISINGIDGNIKQYIQNINIVLSLLIGCILSFFISLFIEWLNK